MFFFFLLTSFPSWKPDHRTHADSAAGVNTDMLSSAVHTRVYVCVLAFMLLLAWVTSSFAVLYERPRVQDKQRKGAHYQMSAHFLC